MLTKLENEQLAEAWPMVERALRSSSVALSSMSEERINNVLQNLLRGNAVCWMHDRGGTITTVVVTAVHREPISGTLNLLVYAAHAFAKCKSGDYIEMAQDLGKYAKAQGCSNILVYSSSDKLTRLLVGNGGVENYTLVVFPLA